LEGYLRSSPVRIGNAAWNQFQLDVYGILLDALYFTHKHGGGIEKREYDYLIKPIVKSMQQVWTRPDSGIWEVRSEEEHFVYSKMWCWVAADRAVKIATALGSLEDAREWTKLRDTIREDIYSKGFDESIGSFVRAYGSKSLDSANLLMPQVRFISVNDPKMIGTIDATMKKLLAEDKFLYRYLDDDGLAGKEGAFLICSFWLVSCLTMAGRLDEAEKMMDSIIGYSNHLGLFSEEIDPKTGEMLGNFPQAFTHMGFITAATTLGRALAKRIKTSETPSTDKA
ncbi:MAG: glycoside hydrolase family 15 protein, partial [Nitrososphaerales archaeon]